MNSLSFTASEIAEILACHKPFKSVIGTVVFNDGLSTDVSEITFKDLFNGTMLVTFYCLGTKFHEIVEQSGFDFLGYSRDVTLRQFDLSMIHDVIVREGDIY